MADAGHLRVLLQGGEAWNEWRQQYPDIRPDISNANLSGADLYRVDFIKTNLSRSDLSDADLSYGTLSGADLSGAKFRGADLSHTGFNNANLRGAYLYQANLSSANLKGACLVEANLSNTDLSNANLSNADFSKALLSNADLSETILGGTRFYLTDLTGARLMRPAAGGAQMDKAILRNTIFADIDLREMQGLEGITHGGPSNLSTSAIRLSHGQMPDSFLQGCGLRDWEIEATKLYRPGLTRNQFIEITYKVIELRTDPLIQFYSCFISYSSNDTDFAKHLYKDLQSSGVRCWFAPEDMKIGDRIRHRIDDSIRMHDKLLLILSETSVASQWIEQEVETALEKERERGCDVLFPIRLDDEVMKSRDGWPAMIRKTRHIGDFREWKKHKEYRQALSDLLDDLREEPEMRL